MTLLIMITINFFRHPRQALKKIGLFLYVTDESPLQRNSKNISKNIFTSYLLEASRFLRRYCYSAEYFVRTAVEVCAYVEVKMILY